MLMKTIHPDNWCLAYTKPQQESVAARNLKQQNFEVYLPQFRTIKKTSKRATVDADNLIKVTYEPLFPRYLFVQLTEENCNITTVRSTRGVNSLVVFGSQLAVIPAALLDKIRDIENYQNGINNHVENPFHPGEYVTIEGTALNGLEGVVQTVSSKRVHVLLEILGRTTTVHVQHQNLHLS